MKDQQLVVKVWPVVECRHCQQRSYSMHHIENVPKRSGRFVWWTCIECGYKRAKWEDYANDGVVHDHTSCARDGAGVSFHAAPQDGEEYGAAYASGSTSKWSRRSAWSAEPNAWFNAGVRVAEFFALDEAEAILYVVEGLIPQQGEAQWARWEHWARSGKS